MAATHFYPEVEAEEIRCGYHVCQWVCLDAKLTGRALILRPAADSSRDREEAQVWFGCEQYIDFNYH